MSTQITFSPRFAKTLMKAGVITEQNTIKLAEEEVPVIKHGKYKYIIINSGKYKNKKVNIEKN